MKSKKKTIMQQAEGTCWLCSNLSGDRSRKEVLHTHHVYDGPNRRISEANGFTVRLCPQHHVIGASAVHNNIGMMRLIQQETQRVFERDHTREEFMELIGRNYL